jgi:hypothetical protein
MDIQQFYGDTLRGASEKHLPGVSGKEDIPRSWYPRMKELLSVDGPRKKKILSYARRDARLAYLLGQKLLNSFGALGIYPAKLNSPASVTMEFFGPQLKDEPGLEESINRKWKNGFFGGRVEIATLGTVERVNLYDIHSAYPAEIARLKSLRDCNYRAGKKIHENRAHVAYGLYHLTAYIPIDWRFGPLAVRDNDRVIYPVGAVKTWCCLPALEVLIERGITFDVHECHEFLGAENRPLIFRGIEGLYQSRKDPVLSLAAKLMLNSLYGKLCEARPERVAVGRDRYRSYRAFGNFTNYVLASQITESVRMKVFCVMAESGRAAHMCATDSVLIEGELPGEVCGPNLGEWELKGHYDRATILGTGRYYLFKKKSDGTGEDVFAHLRGFSGVGKHTQKIMNCRRSYARLPLLQNRSMIQWANGGGADDLNVLGVVKKELRCSDEKRFWHGKFRVLCNAFKDRIESDPWILGNKKSLKKLMGGLKV